MTTRILTDDHGTPADAIDVRFDDEGPGIYLELELRRGDIANALQTERSTAEAQRDAAIRDANLAERRAVQALMAAQAWRTLVEDAQRILPGIATTMRRSAKSTRATSAEQRLATFLRHLDLAGEDELANPARDFVYDDTGAIVSPFVDIGQPVNGASPHRLDWQDRIADEAQRSLSAREARALASALVHHADELDRNRR